MGDIHLGSVFRIKCMAAHVWFYVAETMLGTTQNVGPIEEAALILLARQGKLKRETLVSSPSRTNGNWLQSKGIPGLLKEIESGERERAEAAAQAAQAKAEQRQAQRQAAQNEQQALREHARTLASQAAAISDCPNTEIVTTIRERVQAILTANEVIQYIAVQQKPLVNISPDAMVATNKRLIFYRPKLLGRFEFEDYQWFDLFNAHMQQNLLGAVFTAQHVSGRVLSMDYLQKTACQSLYRMAQEREEEARRQRHQFQIETLRAGATQINVGNPAVPVAAPHAPLSVPASPPDDLVKRLETLKSMFDKGLVSQEEFDVRRKQILDSV
jgi:hypothetical protein